MSEQNDLQNNNDNNNNDNNDNNENNENNENNDNNDNNNNENNNIFSNTNTNIAMNNPIVTTLIEFGYDPTYSKRIFIYFHPTNIEEAIDYLSTENGMIQHNFVQDRNIDIDLCYLCGQEKNIHINNNIQLNNNNEEDNKNINNLEVKSDENEEQKIECLACEELFIETKENKLEKCGHSFCNKCWFDYFSVKINENQMASIQCLVYECVEEPDEDFIINLIKSDQNLVERYKKFKYDLEIINNQNKKFCPFPNCNSFLEIKDINNKEVKCLNNHAFCFFCLEKPHGNSPCKENLLKNSLAEYSKNNLIKRCPKCSITTEKVIGCNHITCPKCNYQWCWLCNGKYDPEHYQRGKCRGFQFFMPQNEEEIKDAFKGKIELRESQRQDDIDYSQQNRSFDIQHRNLFISNNDIHAQNNDNQSADLIIMAKNYVYNTEVDENEQIEENIQNEEENEVNDNINDSQNKENEQNEGNGDDDSNLDNSKNNEQNNDDHNKSNDRNNNENINNDNLFNILNNENENKEEKKDKNDNINNSNRNILNEINNSEKKDLNIEKSNNQNEEDIVNIYKEDTNADNQDVNNDLNQSKLRNNDNDNDNDNDKYNTLNLNFAFDNNIKNTNIRYDTYDNNFNDIDKNEKKKNTISNHETDKNNENNNNNEITTYNKNNFITENDIKITDQKELLTSNEKFVNEKENKDNYKSKKNKKQNITLDIDEENSDNRFNEKNKDKNIYKIKSQLSISYKILLTIIYFLFGHCFIFTNNFLEIIKKDYYKLSFLIILIPYFFLQILINILLFFPYKFKDGLDPFLSEFFYIIRFKYNNLEHFPFHFAYYSAEILFLGTFFGLRKLLIKLLNKKNTFIILFGIIVGIAFLPFHIIVNIIMLIYAFCSDGYDIKKMKIFL